MSQSFRGHWTIQGPADFTGTLHGIEFENGFAYVNWKTLGEDATAAALAQIGHDPRGFRIVEIPEQDSPYGSKADSPRRTDAQPAQAEKPARKSRRATASP